MHRNAAENNHHVRAIDGEQRLSRRFGAKVLHGAVGYDQVVRLPISAAMGEHELFTELQKRAPREAEENENLHPRRREPDLPEIELTNLQ